MSVGKPLAEVVLNTPIEDENMRVKEKYDHNSYYFLKGFSSVISTNSALDHEMLYNNINGYGMMIFGPVEGGIMRFKVDEKKVFAVWITLHELSHSLVETGLALV